MIELYLSGASRELARVRKVAAALEQTGMFHLVDPWWIGAEEWAGKDYLHTRQAAVGYAAGHERAMRDAQIFWLLWPRQGSHGALYELGYVSAHRWHAGSSRVPLVVTGPGASETIYTAAADYRDESDELGLVECMRLANRPVHRAVHGGQGGR